MSRTYDDRIEGFLLLPSLKKHFDPVTGRSYFMESLLKIVDASGNRHSFDSDRLSCMYVMNDPYSTLIIIAEDKFVDGKTMFRSIDIRMQKSRAIVTEKGVPLSVMQQINGNEYVKQLGLVLEQEYGGSYTGKVSYIDPVGLSDGMAQLDRWGVALMEAGYVEAAVKPGNVVHTNNRYAFDHDVKLILSSNGL